MPAVTISEWLDEHLMSSWILMAKWQLNLPVGWSFIKSFRGTSYCSSEILRITHDHTYIS